MHLNYLMSELGLVLQSLLQAELAGVGGNWQVLDVRGYKTGSLRLRGKPRGLFVIWLTAVLDWYMMPVMKAVSVKRFL